MPLSSSQLRRQLKEKKAAFEGFDERVFQLLTAYRQGWKQFNGLDWPLRQNRMRAVPAPRGSVPLEAGTSAGLMRFSCGAPWHSREESLAWARQVLNGVTTFAVDGSQIFPSKDVSLPVALVQIGWFENSHQPHGSYRKDIRLEVLTPEDLKADTQTPPEERRINMRRFEMEIERLVEYMEACRDPRQSLVFFDGALVVSFAQLFEPEDQQVYVQAMLQLLRASERYRVPLVGYVDTSYARDLTALVQQIQELPRSEKIHDAQMLAPLMGWGDCTPLYRCDRGGILAEYEEMAERIGFVYLKTTAQGYPARLEIPLWLWEDDAMAADRPTRAVAIATLIDRVRAEVVAGGGYPYAIETADQTAVIQGQDRQMFYRILQEWAEQESIGLRFSRKMVSKRRRR